MRRAINPHHHALDSALEAALSGVRDPYARRVIAANLLNALQPKRRRKPPESGSMVPAQPPKGPTPLQGGAEAPLEFDA
jgi:hypothetical protein